MVALGSDVSISRYISRVRAIPPLSREEEHELALRVQAGDQDALEKLVVASLRYVVAVAIQYRRYGIRIADLIAEGNVGLMMAVRKFDPDRGTRFVTYAGYWIRAYVLDCVVRSTSMVGAGSGALRSKIFFRLRRERARLANLVSDVDERTELLAEQFHVTAEKMSEMMRRLDGKDVSLDQPVFPDSAVTLLDDLVEPRKDQEVELGDAERIAAARAQIDAALAGLDRRERFIVGARMLTDEAGSLASIGRKLGVSRERARQLEARAKRKLRDSLREFAPNAEYAA